jgi:hypothetical protein
MYVSSERQQAYNYRGLPPADLTQPQQMMEISGLSMHYPQIFRFVNEMLIAMVQEGEFL